MEGDIQITCRSAVYTRSSLSSQLDGLPVGDTGRDGDTQVLTVYGDDLLVCLGSVCQRDLQLCRVVLSAETVAASASAAHASEHLFEEVGEFAAVTGAAPVGSSALSILVLAILLLLGFEFVSVFPVFSVLVIFLPFLRVAEYLIGFIYFLKLAVSVRIIRVQVGMVFSRKLFVRLFDVVLRSAFVYPQNFVIIYIGHIYICY